LVKAVWSKSKKDVTEEEYTKFWEYFTNQKVGYKYKLHYSADVPLSLKALLYIPNMHMEKYLKSI
jgi:HSP90 family molecular chaperone